MRHRCEFVLDEPRGRSHSRALAEKLRASWGPTGKLVKGAVDDFFDCRAVVRNEQVFTPDGAYGHRREVEVAPPRKWSHQLASALGSKLAPVKNSQDVYPPTWAVLK